MVQAPEEARLIKGKKTTESSRTSEARVAMLKAKTDDSSNERLFPDEKPKPNNRYNIALEREWSITRQSHIDNHQGHHKRTVSPVC